MGVVVYHSTDGSAPVLDGLAGSLVNLLKKCLIDGYGAKSPLGWNAYYSASYQRAAFRSAAQGASGFWLYVNDDGTTYPSARTAGAWGYETVTGFSTETLAGAAAQWAGHNWSKSYTADSTARVWSLVGDEKTFYLLADYGHPGYTNRRVLMAFGDFKSYRANDAGSCFLIGHNTSAPQNSRPDQVDTFHSLQAFNAQGTSHQLARDYKGLPRGGNGLAFGKSGDSAVSADLGAAGYAYLPSGHLQEMWVSRIEINEPDVSGAGSHVRRGRLRGAFQPLHTRPIADKATVTGVTGLAGRTLTGFVIPYDSSNNGLALFDTTGPWE